MAIASVYFLHIVYSLYHWFWQYIQCCLLHPAIESIFIIDMLLVHIIIGYVFSWCCPVHIRMRFYPERCSVLMAIYFVYIPNVVLSFIFISMALSRSSTWLFRDYPWLCLVYAECTTVFIWKSAFAYRVKSSREICSINNSFNLLTVSNICRRKANHPTYSTVFYKC
jgi:hypothetical protein